MKYDYYSVPGVIQPPPPGAYQCSFRVHDEQDNRIATCWVEGNAKRIVDALNSQSRIAALEAEVKRLREASQLANKLNALQHERIHLRQSIIT